MLRHASAPRNEACPHRRARSSRTAAGARPCLAAAASAMTLLALTVATAPAAAATTRAAAACAGATAAVGSASGATMRAALQCVINAERARYGLARLAADARLAKAARRHARDMVRHRYFAHERAGWTLAGRLRSAGWTGTRAAEAIAWGCGSRAAPLATLTSWLNSPPHRAIVLGNYRHAGIGLAVKAPTQRCPGGGTWVLDTGA